MTVAAPARALGRDLACSFIDHKLVSKERVRAVAVQQDRLRGGSREPGSFVVSTCLRYERYTLRPSPRLPGLASARGSEAVRRLICVAAGLESEVIGEIEVRHQLIGAADYAHRRGTLTDEQRGLVGWAVEVADELRDRFALTNLDSYASVGARLLANRLEVRPRPVLLVIGAGYMARSFLAHYLTGDPARVIWANRSPRKAELAAADIPALDAMRTMFIGLADVPPLLPIVDGVFAAVGGLDGFFTTVDVDRLANAAAVVDLSYPSLFPAVARDRVVTLTNTDFGAHSRSLPPPGACAAARAAVAGYLR